jgi:DNA-directed RNA polymerase subunit RPC12/RpoP
VVEPKDGVDVYPYRCSDCGQCFACSHKLIGYTHWRCPDGGLKRAVMDPGVRVPRKRGLI